MLLHKHHDLGVDAANIPAHAWALAAKSLENDNIPYNAGQAVRFYLIIDQPSLPHLQEQKRASDAQARDYASAVIDAMGGNQSAYGYLGSQLLLSVDLFPGTKMASIMPRVRGTSACEYLMSITPKRPS